MLMTFNEKTFGTVIARFPKPGHPETFIIVIDPNDGSPSFGKKCTPWPTGANCPK